ncbi:tyrosine-type recombinase/integrase [Paenibacillus tarimensis]
MHSKKGTSLKTLFKEARNSWRGCRKRVPSSVRHTYACHLLDNGALLDFIQGMLGHEKASTTQIYAQLRGERRREFYRCYF